MTCRRRSGVAAVALVLLGATAAAAADQPPKNLHQVGGHWTAWDPPTDTPKGAQVYTVVAGDTFWALAGKFLKNSYLWPQLWEKNRYVKDAHWIYPGDPLVVSLEAVPVEQLGEQDLGGKPATEVTTPATTEQAAANAAAQPNPGLDNAVAPLEPLGSEDDIYCSGYVGEVNEQFGYRVVGSEYNALTPQLGGVAGTYGAGGLYGPADTVKYDLSVGDIIYVDGGAAAGLSPGLLYTAVQPGVELHHPLSGAVVGRLYYYLGRVRVLTVQDKVAIAEIVQACDSIRVGAVLKPFVPEPVPLGRRTGLRPPNMPASEAQLENAPVILGAKDNIFSLGQDHVVYVSMGTDKGAAPGDIYTIYRPNRRGLPPVVLGELAVLSVHPHGSVARILASRHAIYAGDRLQPK